MPATARKTTTVLVPEAIELLARLAPIEGYNLTGLDDIRLLRSDRPLTRTPVLYEPGIVIVCQGRKRGYLGDQVYIYDPQHYLVVSVALPFSMETEASASEPLLALYLRLDFNLATDLMLQLDALAHLPTAAPRGMASTRWIRAWPIVSCACCVPWRRRSKRSYSAQRWCGKFICT